jgi:hypothetical protein
LKYLHGEMVFASFLYRFAVRNCTATLACSCLQRSLCQLEFRSLPISFPYLQRPTLCNTELARLLPLLQLLTTVSPLPPSPLKNIASRGLGAFNNLINKFNLNTTHCVHEAALILLSITSREWRSLIERDNSRIVPAKEHVRPEATFPTSTCLGIA